MSAARDILGIKQPTTPKVTKESLTGAKKKTPTEKAKAPRRPEGINREVYALLGENALDVVPLARDDTSYKAKASLGMQRPRRWEWAPFKNMARPDGAKLFHYRRTSDPKGDYPFAVFNKKVDVVAYTDGEYEKHLCTNVKNWNKDQTDHLIDLANRFDLRFIIMQDRWDSEKYGIKSVEDLKERYYEIAGILGKARGTDKNPYVYDADHERRRKAQLQKLWDRTPEQMEEIKKLKQEIKKFTPEQKALLQKAIYEAEHPNEAGATAAFSEQEKPKPNKKAQPRGKEDICSLAAFDDLTINTPIAKSLNLSLRSESMTLPASLGKRKIKILEANLKSLNIDAKLPAFEDVALEHTQLITELLRTQKLEASLKSSRMELENVKKKMNESQKK